MDVVLHIGAHRTASTTLQKTMGANGAVLAAANVVYWGPKRTRAGLFHGLIGAAGTLDARARAAGLRRVANRVRQAERTGARLLLVSEENCLGSMRAALAGGGLYGDGAARVAAILPAFEGRDVTLALGLRALDDWWSSVQAFRRARGGAEARGETFDPGSRSWRDVVTDLETATDAGRIALWRHERMAARPDLVVAALTGVAAERIAMSEPRNVSRGSGGANDAHGMDGMVRTCASVPTDPSIRAMLRRRYDADVAWLGAGGSRRVQLIDEGPGQSIPAPAGQGRERSHDGELQDHGRHHRRLA